MIQKTCFKGFFLNKGQAQVSGLEVHSCGHLWKDSHMSWVKNRTLTSCALVFYAQGNGWFESASCKRQRIAAGSAIVLFPNEEHSYGPQAGSVLEEYFFIYDGALISHMHSPVFTPKHPMISIPVTPFLLALFNDAITLVSDTSRKSEWTRIPGYLFQVFTEINLLSGTPRGARSYDRGLTELLDAIRKDPAKQWDIHKEGRLLGMSYSLIRKRILEVTGKPPTQFLNEQRVIAGSRLLSEGASIKEACFAVGMEDPCYFSRMFKNTTGQSPRSFCQSIRLWDPTFGKER